MTFFVISFVAGMLTVLAPCILPLLPVVIGAGATGRSRFTPYIVIGSLGISIIIFTFLLKVSTAFITIPPSVWTYLSGGILVAFGLILLFPSLWEGIPLMAKLSGKSNKLVGKGYQKKTLLGDMIIGAALGPVFSTCSPTYFVILATVLPASLWLGTMYLLAYVFGLSFILLLISLLGQNFANKLTAVSGSRSTLKIALGAVFVILGLFIISGLDKQIASKILDAGYFDVTKLEQKLLEKSRDEDVSVTGGVPGTLCDDKPCGNKEPASLGSLSTLVNKEQKIYPPYTDFVNPNGFVNSEPFTLSEYIGKKIILVEFVTYSCINCQRTFPYLQQWHETYGRDGLLVVAIHTPEFSYEKDIGNVMEAMRKEGVTFPVVLDNDYQTWNAYQNKFWPHRYVIDLNGNVVFDHIGEGAYSETEDVIKLLIQEVK